MNLSPIFSTPVLCAVVVFPMNRKFTKLSLSQRKVIILVLAITDLSLRYVFCPKSCNPLSIAKSSPLSGLNYLRNNSAFSKIIHAFHNFWSPITRLLNLLKTKKLSVQSIWISPRPLISVPHEELLYKLWLFFVRY